MTTPSSQKPLAIADKIRLVAAARAATAKAFLTKEGGVRYGAAVFTSTGEILSSGQYSSFNHSINVHAEHGALVLAAMSGTPDVVALAVASTGADAFTRPCGICRQTMLEHASRTGRDFLVLMVAADGTWEESPVSALLPFSWKAVSDQGSGLASGSRPRTPKPAFLAQPDGDPAAILAGDQVRLASGSTTIIWDPNPWPEQMLGKIKYFTGEDGSQIKLPHAFTESYAYERALQQLDGWVRPPCAATVAGLTHAAVVQHYPALPITELPPVLEECLHEFGLVDNTYLGGSRSIGLDVPDSDYDLVIRGPLEKLACFRRALSTRLFNQEIRVPSSSGTWRALGRIFPGGVEAILREARFADTFQEEGRNFALMLCESGFPGPIHGESAVHLGHQAIAGTVLEAKQSICKRASFLLRPSGNDQEPVQVISFHKAAHLVREGDQLALRGWHVRDDNRSLLMQFHPHRDNIVWLPNSRITKL